MKHFQDLSYCICSSQVWLNLLKKSEKIQRELKKYHKKPSSNIYQSIIIAHHLLIWLFQPSLLWLSFCRKCCGWRELFCEPFQPCHLQGPGSHHRSCCCATSFSKKFIHNHNTSSSTNLHVAAAFLLLLSLLVIHENSADYLLVHLVVHQPEPSSSQCWHWCRPPSHHSSWAHAELTKWMQEQVLRGHPSRKVDERLRLGRCDTFFYSCFLGLPSSMTTDQGYIREVSAVSEHLQSLPVAPLLKPPPLTSCHPSWALVELTKSMQEQWLREVILHEKSTKDWALADVIPSFIVVLSMFPHKNENQ